MPAVLIGDLPLEERIPALREATRRVAEQLDMPLTPDTRVYFGTAVYEAFGLTRRQAGLHPQKKLLLKLGWELPAPQP